MKFGVREICDVVFKAKATQKVGNKIFYKGEPVIYFDTLKTSTLEGAATTVYAQGGRGNSRLVAWEGERTVTFTMEDALISPAGFMILSGAGLTEGTAADPIPVHVAETTDDTYLYENAGYILVKEYLSKDPDADIYVMVVDENEEMTEPFIGKPVTTALAEVTLGDDATEADKAKAAIVTAINKGITTDGTKVIKITTLTSGTGQDTKTLYTPELLSEKFLSGVVVMADYYTDKGEGAQQIDITPDKFGGNYYVEASTLFRNQKGVDMAAEFVIPNCKVQSNFTFTMASSGDPSTFTFTLDAFPDYTKFNKTKKVLAAIQIVNETETNILANRTKTNHDSTHDVYFED